MSNEILQIYMALNRNELSTQLALQCAPLITGIKLSNLLIVQKYDLENVIVMFEKTAISYHILATTDLKVTFLLYQKDKLMNYIKNPTVSEFLTIYGYPYNDLNSILKELSYRYGEYLIKKREFPHEVGIFLGYPVEDVADFIQNHGNNALYTGYWKVYHNLPEALKLFETYNQAKELVFHLISQGIQMEYIIENSYTK